MSLSPEFRALLDKYQLSPDSSDEFLIRAALQKLVQFPSNREPILLAYGHVLKEYADFISLVELVQTLQDKRLISLREALMEIHELGKTKA